MEYTTTLQVRVDARTWYLNAQAMVASQACSKNVFDSWLKEQIFWDGRSRHSQTLSLAYVLGKRHLDGTYGSRVDGVDEDGSWLPLLDPSDRIQGRLRNSRVRILHLILLRIADTFCTIEGCPSLRPNTSYAIPLLSHRSSGHVGRLLLRIKPALRPLFAFHMPLAGDCDNQGT